MNIEVLRGPKRSSKACKQGPGLRVLGLLRLVEERCSDEEQGEDHAEGAEDLRLSVLSLG